MFNDDSFQFESREDRELIRYAEEWQSALSKAFPKRSFVCIVVDIQGQSVFASRYVNKLAPPEDVAKPMGDLDETVRQQFFSAKNSCRWQGMLNQSIKTCCRGCYIRFLCLL